MIESQLCEEHYDWARNLLIAKFGDDAESYVGEALLHAVRTYDGERDFRTYAARDIVQRALNAYRSERGSLKSARRVAEDRIERLQDDIGAPNTGRAADRMASRCVADSLWELDESEMSPKHRAIAICMVLGLMNRKDCAKVVGQKGTRFALS
jgi:DNA-directed RNA polymerase specialized sigma24 family protein